MGWACSTHRRDEEFIQYFAWKIFRVRTIHKTLARWKDDIRMDLRK